MRKLGGWAGPRSIRVLVLAVTCVLGAGYVVAMLMSQHYRYRYETPAGQVTSINDIFMPWYGTRALLAGRNVYSEDFTAELNLQLYGGPVPTSGGYLVQSFAYPPYTVLSLAPFAWLPFGVVRWLVSGIFAMGIVASTWLWLRTLGAGRTKRELALVALFALTFLPSLDLLWLQQITGFIVIYLVSAYVATTRRHYAVAGVLLALATIKPQVAAVPVGGLLFWALWRRERWTLPLTFTLTMAAQIALSEWLLPGSMDAFVQSALRHREVNQLQWLLSLIAGSDLRAVTFIVLPLLVLLTWCWWRVRTASPTSPALLHVMGLTFAIGVAVIPYDASAYNKTLLLVPILTLWVAVRNGASGARLVGTVVGVIAPTLVIGLAALFTWLHLATHSALLPSTAFRALQTLEDVGVSLYGNGLQLILLPDAILLCLSRANIQRAAREQNESHDHSGHASGQADPAASALPGAVTRLYIVR